MTRVTKSILILGFLFAFIACSQQPLVPAETTVAAPSETFTPWVEGTQAALASPTPWVAGTETALAVASPTLPALPTFTPVSPLPTFTPFALPEEMFSPVFYGKGPFLLIGGVKKDHGWLSGIQAAQFINSEITYDLLEQNGSIQIRGSALEFDPVCGNHVLPSSVVLSEPVVGVASGWVSDRRGSKDLSTDNAEYVQAVMDWFQSQGNSPAEIRITHILQVDIEGDGIDEILLSASYFKEKLSLLTETGDYSVVLLRKVIGNDVITIPLVKDYYVSSIPEVEVSYPNTYIVVDVLDLNGDGTLEVIVDAQRWEGWGAVVYRVDGQNVREVMRTVCPAG